MALCHCTTTIITTITILRCGWVCTATCSIKHSARSCFSVKISPDEWMNDKHHNNTKNKQQQNKTWPLYIAITYHTTLADTQCIHNNNITIHTYIHCMHTHTTRIIWIIRITQWPYYCIMLIILYYCCTHRQYGKYRNV